MFRISIFAMKLLYDRLAGSYGSMVCINRVCFIPKIKFCYINAIPLFNFIPFCFNILHLTYIDTIYKNRFG